MKEYDKIGVVVNEAKLLQKEIDTTGISFDVNPLKIYLSHFKKELFFRIFVSLGMLWVTFEAKLITLLWLFVKLGDALEVIPDRYALLKIAFTSMWIFSLIPKILLFIVLAIFGIYVAKTVYIVCNILNRLVLNWCITLKIYGD